MSKVELDLFNNVVYDYLAKKIRTTVDCGHKNYQDEVRAIVNWMTYPRKVDNRFLRTVIDRAREKNRQYECDPDKPEN